MSLSRDEQRKEAIRRLKRAADIVPTTRRKWTLEIAKSGRSKCKNCNLTIEKGQWRLGVITYIPFTNCKWHHFGICMLKPLQGATLTKVRGQEQLSEEERTKLTELVGHTPPSMVYIHLPTISGSIDLSRFAQALKGRYNRFRGFRFGLPESRKYTKNWNWRCFLAGMLVCNTKETSMLYVTDKLYAAFPTPEALLSLVGDKEGIARWVAWMKKADLRHAKRKVRDILAATQNIVKYYDGEIPQERVELEEMRGVGRHVASITMAWVHEAPEFGIDVHVRRILTRWNFITDSMLDTEVEETVKKTLPRNIIGHFSRAFVDHGQQVCGYNPDCANCYLRSACPTAAKHFDW